MRAIINELFELERLTSDKTFNEIYGMAKCSMNDLYLLLDIDCFNNNNISIQVLYKSHKYILTYKNGDIHIESCDFLNESISFKYWQCDNGIFWNNIDCYALNTSTFEFEANTGYDDLIVIHNNDGINLDKHCDFILYDNVTFEKIGWAYVNNFNFMA